MPMNATTQKIAARIKLAYRISYNDDFGIEYVQLTPDETYEIYGYASK